ncbi:MAG TPA: SBBP repeat-containing protein [Coleofasciculaceae cyanobacterium]
MPLDNAKKTLNTLNAAKLLVPSAKSIRGAVGRLDATDLYRVQLGSRSSLTLKLAGVDQKAKIAVQVFTLNGVKQKILKAIGSKDFGSLSGKVFKKYFQSVGETQVGNRQSKALALDLESGEYYVRVYQRKGTSQYRLNVLSAPLLSTNQPPATGGTPPTQPAPLFTLNQRWLNQLVAPNGTSGNDYTYGTTTDSSGNLYVAGVTNATVGQAGDGFVAEYDTNGNLLWKRSIATPGSDVAFDVAVDQEGSYYVTGATVTGSGLTLNSDVFVTKYSKAGEQQWIKTISTPKAAGEFTNALESGAGIALDGNSVYVTGILNSSPLSSKGQAFIAKYNVADGSAVTTFGDAGIAKLGNSGVTAATDLAVSNGNVYITGVTGATLLLSSGSLKFSDGDAFVAGFSGNGALLWNQTLASSGTAQDYARGIAVLGSDIYITGQTAGALPSGSLPANTYAGKDDGFLAKYSNGGTFQWAKQFGTSGLDQGQAIATDNSGRIYVTGETDQALFGNAAGGSDAWLAAYNAGGSLLSSTQLGTNKDDETYGISVDSAGNVYIAGQTNGAFAGSTNAGQYDAWVAKFGTL